MSRLACAWGRGLWPSVERDCSSIRPSVIRHVSCTAFAFSFATTAGPRVLGDFRPHMLMHELLEGVGQGRSGGFVAAGRRKLFTQALGEALTGVCEGEDPGKATLFDDQGRAEMLFCHVQKHSVQRL